MKKLTMFCTCKPFRGLDEVAQLNAIESWIRLRPRPEVLLCGDDYGTREVAKAHGLEFRDVQYEEGLPLVNDIFRVARRAAAHETLVFVNADIILMQEFMTAVNRVVNRFDRVVPNQFLMIGQKHNLVIQERLEFSGGWQSRLRARAYREGSPHGICGKDYFVFPRSVDFSMMPPFRKGRTIYDSWLVHAALAANIPVIDATAVVLACHPDHGRPSRDGPQFAYNRSLYRDLHGTHITEATWVLTPERLEAKTG